MHIKNKSLLITLIAGLSLNLIAETELFAASNYSKQINFENFDVLSPEVILNKASLRKLFADIANKIKVKETKQERISFFSYIAASNPKKTLTDMFGRRSMTNILDVATGNGEWMVNSVKQPWVSDDPNILGIELKSPDFYPGQAESAVYPEKHWKRRGLKVVDSEYDQAFPKKGTLDLIHESFIDERRIVDHSKRLNRYHELVKAGGWMLFAHIQYGFYIKKKSFTTWLDKKNYSYEVFSLPVDSIPEDYPKTYWWLYFEQTFRLGKQLAPNYLIVAQKTTLSTTSYQFAKNGLIEQSL